MILLSFSHKVCWRDDASPSGFVTNGGFPFQIQAISGIFDETRLVVLEGTGEPPQGLSPICGRRLSVISSREPSGKGILRKFGAGWWSVRNAQSLIREIRKADAIHAIVPGDIGFIGLLLALVGRKPLFVRHCGTWGHSATLADRALMAVLRRVAGGRVVVLATGGGEEPPEPSNPAVSWIFSTSLRDAELAPLRRDRFWSGGPLRLISVGRLDRGKNTIASIEALPAIRKLVPGSTLEIVGDGPEEGRLRQRAAGLELESAVRFYGNLDHKGVLDVLKRGDLFLFPTRVAEGFPKAVLEALAAGLPVVAPRISVLPHLIGARCGVLLEGTDPSDVVAAVSELTSNTERFQKRARAAQTTASEFTLERWAAVIRGRLQSAWDRPLCVTVEGETGRGLR